MPGRQHDADPDDPEEEATDRLLDPGSVDAHATRHHVEDDRDRQEQGGVLNENRKRQIDQDPLPPSIAVDGAERERVTDRPASRPIRERLTTILAAPVTV